MILPLCKSTVPPSSVWRWTSTASPATADGRFAIAQRIVKAANAVGIPNEDILH